MISEEHHKWLKEKGFSFNTLVNGYYKLTTPEEYLIVRPLNEGTKFKALKIRLCEKAGESTECDSPEEAIKEINDVGKTN